jgi:hypothetical protein
MSKIFTSKIFTSNRLGRKPTVTPPDRERLKWGILGRHMKDRKPNHITRKIVNYALRARGRDESLREGDGYFYFGGGDAVNWLSTTVPVKRLSDLTVEQWLAEFDKLRQRENTLRKQMPKAPKAPPRPRGKK